MSAINNIEYVIARQSNFNNELCGLKQNLVKTLTNFSGSAALLIYEKNNGHTKLLFVDPRYSLQASRECPNDIKVITVKSASFKDEMIRKKVSEITENNALQGLETIFNFNDEEFSLKEANEIEGLNPGVECKIENKSEYVENKSYVQVYDLKYSGETTEQKHNNLIEKTIKKLAGKLDGKKFAILITSPESIAWLFNLRDCSFNTKNHNSPTFISMALCLEKKSFLFVEDTTTFQNNDFPTGNIVATTFKKFPHELLAKLEEEKIETIVYDESKISKNLYTNIKNNCANLISLQDQCTNLRSIKNEVEIKNSKEIHEFEGMAIIKLFIWLASAVSAKTTEFEVSLQLEKFRAEQKRYMGKSFESIIGFGANSAVIHYCPQKDACLKLEPNNILLLDVGGHYLGGTTDMTRTIWLSKTPPLEIKKIYTKVLKGHIALSTIIFPKETSGRQIDVLARQFLWADFYDYPHGTGHGVGNFLAVHEGNVNISRNSNEAIQKGMIISNEPGYYKENAFGIRLENLMIAEYANEDFLKFSALTIVPFQFELIDFDLLTDQEKYWLLDYHKKIAGIFEKYGDKIVTDWLNQEYLKYEKALI